MKEFNLTPAGLQMLHDYMDSLEAENKRLRKDQKIVTAWSLSGRVVWA